MFQDVVYFFNCNVSVMSLSFYVCSFYYFSVIEIWLCIEIWFCCQNMFIWWKTIMLSKHDSAIKIWLCYRNIIGYWNMIALSKNDPLPKYDCVIKIWSVIEIWLCYRNMLGYDRSRYIIFVNLEKVKEETRMKTWLLTHN